ncbi:MAG: hypothetical protein MUE53_05790 [Chitinophagales bacterium]|jgi:arsenate reductase|nr:hypothetical protein [Chitinophagales bacterium]
MKPIEIWHYDKCTTSSQILKVVLAKYPDISVRHYQSQPPSISELEAVSNKLFQPFLDMLRTNDKMFKLQEFDINQEVPREVWFARMAEFPSIIQRPIIIYPETAYIGRPKEVFIKNFLQT